MASAAEQLAANMNIGSFAKATELHKRLLFTLGALLVYRIGTFVPIPGINSEAFLQFFQNPDGQRVIDTEWVQVALGRAHARVEMLTLLNWKLASDADRGVDQPVGRSEDV